MSSSVLLIEKNVANSALDNPEKGEIFNSFNELQTEKITSIVNEAFKHLNDIDDNDTKALIDLALDFSLSAVAYINIAKKILFLTRVYDEINNPVEEKDKDKKKEKENKDEK